MKSLFSFMVVLFLALGFFFTGSTVPSADAASTIQNAALAADSGDLNALPGSSMLISDDDHDDDDDDKDKFKDKFDDDDFDDDFFFEKRRNPFLFFRH
jgi:hypothetical protein